MNLLPVSLALAAAFSWVFGQVLGKLVVRDLNPTTFNSIGFSFLAVVLTPVVLFTGLGNTADWPNFLALIAGVLGFFVTLQIYFYDMKRAPAHKVVTVANSASVWTVFFALVLLGEKITVLSPISLGLVVGGAFLLAPRSEGNDNWRWAVPLALTVAILWGLNKIMQKSAMTSGMSPWTFIWIAVVSAATSFDLTAVITKSWRGQRFTRRSVGLSIASGLSNNLFGYIFYMSALQLENVSSLAPFTSATIPFGFILSILLVRERPSWKCAIGMVLVFLGVILATL